MAASRQDPGSPIDRVFPASLDTVKQTRLDGVVTLAALRSAEEAEARRCATVLKMLALFNKQIALTDTQLIDNRGLRAIWTSDRERPFVGFAHFLSSEWGADRRASIELHIRKDAPMRDIFESVAGAGMKFSSLAPIETRQLPSTPGVADWREIFGVRFFDFLRAVDRDVQTVTVKRDTGPGFQAQSFKKVTELQADPDLMARSIGLSGYKTVEHALDTLATGLDGSVPLPDDLHVYLAAHGVDTPILRTRTQLYRTLEWMVQDGRLTPDVASVIRVRAVDVAYNYNMAGEIADAMMTHPGLEPAPPRNTVFGEVAGPSDALGVELTDEVLLDRLDRSFEVAEVDFNTIVAVRDHADFAVSLDDLETARIGNDPIAMALALSKHWQTACDIVKRHNPRLIRHVPAPLLSLTRYVGVVGGAGATGVVGGALGRALLPALGVADAGTSAVVELGLQAAGTAGALVPVTWLIRRAGNRPGLVSLFERPELRQLRVVLEKTP